MSEKQIIDTQNEGHVKKHEKEGPYVSQGQPWNLCPKTKMKTKRKTERKTKTKTKTKGKGKGKGKGQGQGHGV